MLTLMVLLKDILKKLILKRKVSKQQNMQNYPANKGLKNSLFLSIFSPKRTLNSKKYGVDLIRYTHAVNTALHSSTKIDGK